MHGIGAHLNAGTSSPKLAYLLLHLYIGTVSRQERCECKSANAGTNDSELGLAIMEAAPEQNVPMLTSHS
jgi:hypothetical protein